MGCQTNVGLENGFEKPRFLGFFKKRLKILRSPNFRFFKGI